jgi:hypothetical protein
MTAGLMVLVSCNCWLKSILCSRSCGAVLRAVHNIAPILTKETEKSHGQHMSKAKSLSLNLTLKLPSRHFCCVLFVRCVQVTSWAHPEGERITRGSSARGSTLGLLYKTACHTAVLTPEERLGPASQVPVLPGMELHNCAGRKRWKPVMMTVFNPKKSSFTYLKIQGDDEIKSFSMLVLHSVKQLYLRTSGKREPYNLVLCVCVEIWRRPWASFIYFMLFYFLVLGIAVPLSYTPSHNNYWAIDVFLWLWNWTPPSPELPFPEAWALALGVECFFPREFLLVGWLVGLLLAYNKSFGNLFKFSKVSPK